MESSTLASRIPLVHFPAFARLEPEEDGQPVWTAWDRLRSKRERGEAEPPDELDKIRWDHVFLYAGPPCFALSKNAIGDSILYFHPSADRSIEQGHASPFDTGACRPTRSGGFLQPFADRDAQDCRRLIEEHSADTKNWRGAFEQWLSRCYDRDPTRYLETSDDPYRDGEPDRTEPPELLMHNGTRGREKHRKCADRRAWTWELRSRTAMEYEHLAALQVVPRTLRRALSYAERHGLKHGDKPKVRVTPNEPSSPALLYRSSGDLLRELTSDPPDLP